MRTHRKPNARRSTIGTSNLVQNRETLSLEVNADFCWPRIIYIRLSDFSQKSFTLLLRALRNVWNFYAALDFLPFYSLFSFHSIYIYRRANFRFRRLLCKLWNQTDKIGIFSAGVSVVWPQTVSAAGGCNIKYLAISYRMHGLHECKSGSRRGHPPVSDSWNA